MTHLRESQIQGDVSAANSTTVALGAGGVFTGEWVEILNYGIVFINTYSDVASAGDGLCVQQSSDGVNTDHDDCYSVAAATGKNFSINPHAQYMRVVYTNGIVDQTEFRLQTIIKGNSKPSSHKINDDLAGDDDSELVSAILKVQTNDNETYRNIDVQNPLPSDGDTTYPKDLLLSLSDIGSFTGDISNLLGKDDFQTTLTATGATNPKYIEFVYRRPVLTSLVGIVARTGDFSNLKAIVYGIDGTAITILDDSGDSTKKTRHLILLEPTTFTKLRLEFHTVDTVSITIVVSVKDVSTVSRIQGQSEVTGLIENVKTFNGALNVTDGLVHKKPFNVAFSNATGTTTTPSVAISSEDTDITFTSVVGLAIGSLISITEGDIYEMDYPLITNIVGNVVTVNRPVDNDYTTAAVISEVVINMNVDGSGAPVSYIIEPPSGETWQITRLMINMLDGSAMDDGMFGGIAALTNGVLLRAHNSGNLLSPALWQTNGDIANDMYDVDYADKAPAGQYGLRGRWTFTKMGAVVELIGSEVDFIEILIQDDLTGLLSFTIKAQGRIFGN